MISSPARELLLDDHRAVHEVLERVLTSLHDKDIGASYSSLDLLWARLAVHIRAEHLHLFPAVINRLRQSIDNDAAPALSEAQSTVDKLRADHDFFMRELARDVGILRELPRPFDGVEDRAKLSSVLESVLEIERRLASHNEIEENQIYCWASAILTEPEQIDLARRINAELEHRPSRFSVATWANHS